ncbi:hypothetical protein QBC39DRAFT_374106 [Podospora conica]|nr:hypothetical protein QBC39DRAFT_374106 [Schizothecium conicum]
MGPEMMPIPVGHAITDAELLETYIKLISPFKASIDGNPDPSNPYLKYHVPYTVQSSLLVDVAKYTAACFLSETGHVDTTRAMDYKGYAIKRLNEHIRSTSLPSDEGITGVIQLIIDEWLWGDTNDLRAHLTGLHDMIRLRGGFRTLGLHGLISKLAITSDVAVALSFEVPPFLLDNGPDFSFSEGPALPLRLALNTPFLSSLPPLHTLPRFADCDDVLPLHPAVASLLDDMRFLLAAVHALPDRASPKDLQKVHTTAAWIHERILSLPADGPEPRPPPPPPGKRPDPTDSIYQAVRLAALLYAHSIKVRRPFSVVVGQAEYARLWTTAWRVPLGTWRSLLGVFVWMLVPLVPAGRGTEHDRFVKAMFGVALLQVGMDNWDVCAGVMGRVGGLVRWLGGGGGEGGSPGPGGEGSEGGSPGVGEGKGKGKEREV